MKYILLLVLINTAFGRGICVDCYDGRPNYEVTGFPQEGMLRICTKECIRGARCDGEPLFQNGFPVVNCVGYYFCECHNIKVPQKAIKQKTI